MWWATRNTTWCEPCLRARVWVIFQYRWCVRRVCVFAPCWKAGWVNTQLSAVKRSFDPLPSVLQTHRYPVLSAPPCYLPHRTREHTTWCLINQHFGNIILSNPDQSRRQPEHHHRSYSAFLHISCTKSTIKCSALPLTYCKVKQSSQ